MQIDSDYIIVGGGAAGIFCAINLARLKPKARVLVLEKTNKLLSKVKISGGGRCNVTHHCSSIAEMSACYPRGQEFVYQSFQKFFTNHTIEWFAKRGIPLKVEADGRMFPATDDSQTIIDCFLYEAKKYKVEIKTQTEVMGLKQENNLWVVQTKTKNFYTNAVCLALGGYPKLSQYNWLANLKHNIIEPLPSLFTFNIPNAALNKLMGVSKNNIEVKILNSEFKNIGSGLITHWGLSGPAVLKLSAFAARYIAELNYDFKISVNWVSKTKEEIKQLFNDIRTLNPKQKLAKPLFDIPARLWIYLIEQAKIDDQIFWTSLSGKAQNLLIENLCNSIYTIKGKTTFKEEFVTCGGFDVCEVNVNTMESLLHKQLYFAGEVLNVDGITGGYNFQHAWTSAYIAAQSMSNL